MKRITIEDVVEVSGAEPGRRAYRAHYSLHNGRVYTVLIPSECVTAVEDTPDPLPTEEGVHIVATVKCGSRAIRTVLCLVAPNEDYPWRSATQFGLIVRHNSEDISDWRILDLDAYT